MRRFVFVGIVGVVAATGCATSSSGRGPSSAPAAAATEGPCYSRDEILLKAEVFFGDVTEGLARAIEKAFADSGRPVGYIMGEEGAGAIGVGLRYGNGRLHRKGQAAVPVWWQGPSIGFGVVLAPIRTGVGARAEANVGYLHYTREEHLNPL